MLTIEDCWTQFVEEFGSKFDDVDRTVLKVTFIVGAAASLDILLRSESLEQSEYNAMCERLVNEVQTQMLLLNMDKWAEAGNGSSKETG